MGCNCGKRKMQVITAHQAEMDRQRNELEQRMAAETARASDAANTPA